MKQRNDILPLTFTLKCPDHECGCLSFRRVTGGRASEAVERAQSILVEEVCIFKGTWSVFNMGHLFDWKPNLCLCMLFLVFFLRGSDKKRFVHILYVAGGARRASPELCVVDDCCHWWGYLCLLGASQALEGTSLLYFSFTPLL